MILGLDDFIGRELPDRELSLTAEVFDTFSRFSINDFLFGQFPKVKHQSLADGFTLVFLLIQYVCNFFGKADRDHLMRHVIKNFNSLVNNSIGVLDKIDQLRQLGWK